MRILITGGFGFVGGRLAQHLQQAGHDIILGSRKNLTSPDWLTQCNVTQVNWEDINDLERICKNVDVVIQAAGINALDSGNNPVAALNFNGLATARLVTAASHVGVGKFIYLSTAHVYANPLIGSISEDNCPRNYHPYASSHLAGENFLLGACERGEINGVVLRLSNAFGAPVHQDVNCWMLLANDLCKQAIQSGEMVLHSSGQQRRDFITLTEVCRIVEYFCSDSYEPSARKIFNVGSGNSQSIADVARLIQMQCKKILDFTPVLHCKNIDKDEKNEMLDFSVRRLKQLGIIVKSDDESEIDDLLRFCFESFRDKRNLKN